MSRRDRDGAFPGQPSYSADPEAYFEHAAHTLLRRGLSPTGAAESWDKLRSDVERAYGLGHLSDGEHDRLLNFLVGLGLGSTP